MNLQALRQLAIKASSIKKITSICLLGLCLSSALFLNSAHSIEHAFHDQTEVCYIYESLEKSDSLATSFDAVTSANLSDHWRVLRSQIFAQTKRASHKTRAPPTK